MKELLDFQLYDKENRVDKSYSFKIKWKIDNKHLI